MSASIWGTVLKLGELAEEFGADYNDIDELYTAEEEDFEAWRAALSKRISKKGRVKVATKALDKLCAAITMFKRLDTNDDGELTNKEVHPLLTQIGKTDEEVNAAIKQMEASGNGDGKVTFAEFLQWYAMDDDLLQELRATSPAADGGSSQAVPASSAGAAPEPMAVVAALVAALPPRPLDPQVVRSLELVNTLQDIFSKADDGADYQRLLPRICVSGGQSAGKSSLLSAIVSARMIITGSGQVEFNFLPAADGTCTRCPCIVQMMTVPDTACTAEVHTGSAAASVCISGPASGKPSKTEFDAFAAKIASAIAAAQSEIVASSRNKKISNRPITCKLRGPPFPCLTLVDLPGLIRNNRDQRGEGTIEGLKSSIEQMVWEEIKEKSTIMLCVSSAVEETNMSEGIGLQEKFDPTFERSVPVFTKTDRLFDKHQESNLDMLGDYTANQKKVNAKASCFGTCNPPKELPASAATVERLRGVFGANLFGNMELRSHLEIRLAQQIRKRLPEFRKFLDRKLIDLRKACAGQEMSWGSVGNIIAVFSHAVHLAYEQTHQKNDQFKLSKDFKKTFRFNMQRQVTVDVYRAGIKHIQKVDVYREAAAEDTMLSMDTEDVLEQASAQSMMGMQAVNLSGHTRTPAQVAAQMGKDLVDGIWEVQDESSGIKTVFVRDVAETFRATAMLFVDKMSQTDLYIAGMFKTMPRDFPHLWTKVETDLQSIVDDAVNSHETCWDNGEVQDYNEHDRSTNWSFDKMKELLTNMVEMETSGAKDIPRKLSYSCSHKNALGTYKACTVVLEAKGEAVSFAVFANKGKNKGKKIENIKDVVESGLVILPSSAKSSNAIVLKKADGSWEQGTEELWCGQFESPDAMCEMENAIAGVLKAKKWVASASGELGKIVEEAQLPSTTAWGPNWGQDFKSGLHASKLCSPAFKKFLLEMNKNPEVAEDKITVDGIHMDRKAAEILAETYRSYSLMYAVFCVSATCHKALQAIVTALSDREGHRGFTSWAINRKVDVYGMMEDNLADPDAGLGAEYFCSRDSDSAADSKSAREAAKRVEHALDLLRRHGYGA